MEQSVVLNKDLADKITEAGRERSANVLSPHCSEFPVLTSGFWLPTLSGSKRLRGLIRIGCCFQNGRRIGGIKSYRLQPGAFLPLDDVKVQ